MVMEYAHNHRSQLICFLTVDPPMITRHPESKSIVTGTPTAFTVEATGDELQFQWQKDGEDIDRNESRLQCSQTDKTSTLHIQCVEKSDKGHYTCLVKNAVQKNEEISREAELTVCELSFCVCIFALFVPVFKVSLEYNYTRTIISLENTPVGNELK